MTNDILLDCVRSSWGNAVRAMNYCENQGLKDTGSQMLEIVGKLSQVLEFHECLSASENDEAKAGEPVEQSPEERAANHLQYLQNLDKLRQEAGITAAMLRDGRAKAIMHAGCNR